MNKAKLARIHSFKATPETEYNFLCVYISDWMFVCDYINNSPSKVEVYRI